MTGYWGAKILQLKASINIWYEVKISKKLKMNQFQFQWTRGFPQKLKQMVLVKDLDSVMGCILSKSWAMPHWGNWLIHWRTKLPFRGTSKKDETAVRNVMKINKPNGKSHTWDENPPYSSMDWGLTSWTAALQEGPWGSLWTSWTWASNVSLQQRSSRTSCAALARVEPASPRKLLFPSIFVIPHLEHCIQFWASQYKTEYWHIRVSPKNAPRNQGLKNIIYEKRLKKWGIAPSYKGNVKEIYYYSLQQPSRKL